MKKKYYSWQECINLKEVKVCQILWISEYLENVMRQCGHDYCAFFFSPYERWTIQALWSLKRSLESMIFYILCLSTWYNFLAVQMRILPSLPCTNFRNGALIMLFLPRISIYINSWKIVKSLFLRLKYGTGPFKYFTLLLTCISVGISIVIWSLVWFSILSAWFGLGLSWFSHPWSIIFCLIILIFLITMKWWAFLALMHVLVW